MSMYNNRNMKAQNVNIMMNCPFFHSMIFIQKMPSGAWLSLKGFRHLGLIPIINLKCSVKTIFTLSTK